MAPIEAHLTLPGKLPPTIIISRFIPAIIAPNTWRYSTA